MAIIRRIVRHPEGREEVFVPHKDQLEVEYALRIANKPIGVAQYTLSKKLPKELQGKLPTAEQFKQMLEDDNEN